MTENSLLEPNSGRSTNGISADSIVSGAFERPETIESRITEALFTIVVAGCGPLLAYVFELGRAMAFDIPAILVRPDAIAILSFAVAMLPLLSVPAFGYLPLLVIGGRDLRRPIWTVVVFAAVSVLMAFFPGKLFTFWGLLICGSLGIIALGILRWAIEAARRNLTTAADGHRVVASMAVALCGIVSVGVYAGAVGYRWEHSQKSFLVIRQGGVTAIVARIYGEQMVCVELVDSRVGHKFYLFKTGDGIGTPLSLETLENVWAP